MTEPWTILYQNALQSAPTQLLETTLAAIIAIHARLYTIGFFSQDPADIFERKALLLAASDLRVLRRAFGRVSGSAGSAGRSERKLAR
jgi:hypothetical protein